MIELVADRLSPSERARWRANLADPLAARISLTDPVVRLLGAGICSAALLFSFEGAGHGSLIGLVRMVALGALTFSVASAIERARAGRGPWPSGRFVLPWGYVEVDHGVLRAYPRSELTHEIRGRWLGLGRVRLRLHAARWSRSMTIDATEAERIAIAWAEPADALPQPATGYREPPPQPELANGVSPRWRPPPPFGRLLLAISAAPIALLFSTHVREMPRDAPVAPVASAAVVVDRYAEYTDHFAYPLRDTPDADLSVHLERCSFDEMMAATVESYLTLGLERRRLGPADLGAIPLFTRDAETPVQIWARCTWAVDPESGTFDHVEARWGIARGGASRLTRHATIDVSDVTSVMTSCADAAYLSPGQLAQISLVFTNAVIRRDIYRAAREEAVTPFDRCMAYRVAAISVRTVLAPPPS